MSDDVVERAITAVRAIAAALPDDFAYADPATKKHGRCIEAARLLVPTLRKVGIEARGLACDVMAMNHSARLQLINGVAPNDIVSPAVIIQLECDRASRNGFKPKNSSEPFRHSGFGGHLVVAGDGWFADLTCEQFHHPEYGIFVDGGIVGDKPPEGGQHMLRDGGILQWRWRPEIASWRRAPAWRQDVDDNVINGAAKIAREALDS